VKQVNLLDGPIDSSLRKFAIPLAISFIVNLLYAWIDLYFVSKLGHNAVAALGVSERIWFFTFAIGSGFAVGSSIIISRRIGEGKSSEAGNIAMMSIILMFTFGIILAGLLHYFLDEIYYILGIKGNIKVLSSYYFIALVWGVPFNFLIFQVNAIIRSAGNSSYPMNILLISSLANVILAPILIFGFWIIKPMGIFGAGLATSISFLISAIYSILILLIKFKIFRINLREFSFNFETLKKIGQLGIPASIQLVVISITSMGIAANANIFGSEVLSTFIIGLRVDLMVSMSIFAVGAAMEIISGQNIGAGKIDRIFLYQKSAIKQLTIILLIFGTFTFFFGKYLAMIFSDNQQIIDGVGLYLKFASIGYIPFAIGIIGIRIISGAGDYTRSLMIVVISLGIIQLPGAYFLSHLLNNSIGIWISSLSSMLIFALFSTLEIRKKRWLRVKI
jgi:putative MATE family efflux protein